MLMRRFRLLLVLGIYMCQPLLVLACVKDGQCAYRNEMLRGRCCSREKSYNDACFHNIACGAPVDLMAPVAFGKSEEDPSARKAKLIVKTRHHHHHAHFDPAQSGVARCEGHDYDEFECAQIGCCEFDEDTCISKIGRRRCANGHLPQQPPTNQDQDQGENGPTTSPTQAPTDLISPRCVSAVKKAIKPCDEWQHRGFYCVADCESKVNTALERKLFQSDEDAAEARQLQECALQVKREIRHEFCWPDDCRPIIEFYCKDWLNTAVKGYMPSSRGYKDIYFSGCELCLSHYAYFTKMKNIDCWMTYKNDGAFCPSRQLESLPDGEKLTPARTLFSSRMGMAVPKKNMPAPFMALMRAAAEAETGDVQSAKCEVGQWGHWSPCSRGCSTCKASQMRMRIIHRKAADCPSTMESQACVFGEGAAKAAEESEETQESEESKGDGEGTAQSDDKDRSAENDEEPRCCCMLHYKDALLLTSEVECDAQPSCSWIMPSDCKKPAI